MTRASLDRHSLTCDPSTPLSELGMHSNTLSRAPSMKSSSDTVTRTSSAPGLSSFTHAVTVESPAPDMAMLCERECASLNGGGRWEGDGAQNSEGTNVLRADPAVVSLRQAQAAACGRAGQHLRARYQRAPVASVTDEQRATRPRDYGKCCASCCARAAVAVCCVCAACVFFLLSELETFDALVCAHRLRVMMMQLYSAVKTCTSR